MDRASATDEVDLDAFPGSGLTEDFKKLVFTASLLAFSIERDSVEKKPACSVGKALNEIPPALSGRQLATINRTDTHMQ